MDKILVLDFNLKGHYEKISIRLKELGIRTVSTHYSLSLEEIRSMKDLKGIIFSGSGDTTYFETSAKCDMGVYDLGIPVLGICYGMQLINQMLGGKVMKAVRNEHGPRMVKVTAEDSILFNGIEKNHQVSMSHNDEVVALAPGFVCTAHTDDCKNAACEDAGRRFYATQFHPERPEESLRGDVLLKNFVYKICGYQD